MASLLDWGIDVIVWCQQFSPSLDFLFKFFTFTGDETFYLLLLPLVYWCIDRDAGLRLAILFLVCAYFNGLAKVLLKQPRPFVYDPSARALVHAEGYGLPSGHTQNTVALWGFLAAHYRRAWLIALAAVMILMVPLSRVYLGVHFPTDLAGGYLLGLLCLVLFFILEKPVRAWLSQRPLIIRAGLALLLPAVLALAFPARDPQGVTTSAALCGLCLGALAEQRRVGFQTSGAFWKRCLRFLLGLVVVAVFYVGLKFAFKNLEPAALFRFIRYTLVGLGIAFIAPLVFVKLHLAERATESR